MEKRQRCRFLSVSKSTRAFWREARATRGFSFFDFIHGYIYARWPYHYIGIGKGDHYLVQKFTPLIKLWRILFPDTARTSLQHSTNQASHTVADGYHGKTLPLEKASQLLTINEPIRVPDLEQVIPYVRARTILIENPEQIAVIDCPCRASLPNPCLPHDVCMIVGEPFVSFVIEHQPKRSRRITSVEALQILETEDEKGHVHHAFFKDAMLDRFYAICNCCSCCCGAINAHKNDIPMLESSGYVAVVREDQCIGCGICAAYCQFDALQIKSELRMVDTISCMGCGVCIDKCPEGAIKLVRDEGKGVPLEIHSLMDEIVGQMD
jgi:Pyruvate/2-oxoacid:ferredoxin oxidoreductase delta subunit